MAHGGITAYGKWTELSALRILIPIVDMEITINLSYVLALILIGVLIYLIVVILTPVAQAPAQATVVDVVQEPRGWGWWPWNWISDSAIRPWSYYWGGGHGDVYFGPGKPCHGWFCGDGHKSKPAPQPAPQPAPTPFMDGPLPTVPLQTVTPPPTGAQDMEVALASSAKEIAVPQEVSTQTEPLPIDPTSM
jgi:hypothetical protein